MLKTLGGSGGFFYNSGHRLLLHSSSFAGGTISKRCPIWTPLLDIGFRPVIRRSTCVSK